MGFNSAFKGLMSNARSFSVCLQNGSPLGDIRSDSCCSAHFPVLVLHGRTVPSTRS